MTITSSHNDKLKEIRRLARRRAARATRRASSPRARISSPPRRAAGWEPVVPADGGRQRPGRRRGRAGAAGRRSPALGSGTAHDRRLRAALGGADAARCASRCGASATPATSARSCARRCAFGAASVVLGPGLRRPVRPQGRARLDGRDLRGAGRAGRRRRRAARASGSRSSPRRARRSPGPAGGEVERCVVGAERDGLPADVVAACDRVAHIPIASESLNAAMAATVALYELTRGALG